MTPRVIATAKARSGKSSKVADTANSPPSKSNAAKATPPSKSKATKTNNNARVAKPKSSTGRPAHPDRLSKAKSRPAKAPYVLLAAADIGSNAMRVVLVSARWSKGRWNLSREQALRLPVRMGSDVFAGQPISPETTQRLLSAMWIYRELIDLYEPFAHRACATSALREAPNSVHVLQAVRKSCGIDIELIDGNTEAQLIYSSLADAVERPKAPRTLHIDVGGGSTELILGTPKRVLELASFKVGSVRRIQGQGARELGRMRQWVRNNVAGIERLGVTASGGNARQLYKLVGKKRFIDITELRALHQRLSAISVNKRISDYSLRPDRADTIVPAGEIYLSVLEASKHRHLYIPRANLVGGILKDLARTIDPKEVGFA